MNENNNASVLSEEDLKNLNILCFKILPNKKEIKLDKFVFGCALKYILIGQEGRKGQGDINEGLLARYHKENTFGRSRISQYIGEIGKTNLCICEKDNFIELYRKTSLTMPIGCFYTEKAKITDRLPKSSFENLIIVIEIIIKRILFADFANEDSGSIDFDSLILVNYQSEKLIYESILKSLTTNFDVKCCEVLIRDINYFRKKGAEWECPEYLLDIDSVVNDIPYELFYKDSDFAYQNEKRILVNNKNFKLTGIKYFNYSTNKFESSCFDILSKIIDIDVQGKFKAVETDGSFDKDQPITFRISFPLSSID